LGFVEEILNETQEHDGSLLKIVAFDEWRDDFIEAHYSEISILNMGRKYYSSLQAQTASPE
jgi:hypothetical protein